VIEVTQEVEAEFETRKSMNQDVNQWIISRGVKSLSLDEGYSLEKKATPDDSLDQVFSLRERLFSRQEGGKDLFLENGGRRKKTLCKNYNNIPSQEYLVCV
jgi:hypothetical protein